MAELVANSAGLAVKINWNVRVSDVVFYLTFSCELAKATARCCQAISSVCCRKIDSILVSSHSTGGANSLPSGTVFMYADRELAFGC